MCVCVDGVIVFLVCVRVGGVTVFLVCACCWVGSVSCVSVAGVMVLRGMVCLVCARVTGVGVLLL